MKRKPTEMPSNGNQSVPQIRRALEDLGEFWMYRKDFLDHYKINPNKLTLYRSNFAGHFFQFGARQIWSGSKKTIADMREKLNA